MNLKSKLKLYEEFTAQLVNERLASGLKALLQVGATITKKDGEDALIKLSDEFDRIDDEYAGDIASHLDMAIELMQDGYPGDATNKLKQFNKACQDVLKGKSIKSAFEGKVNEAAGDSSSASQINSVAIDQTKSQPSAAEIIRTEVIRDVDTILNNLIELSDRVEEANQLEIDELYEELFQLLNVSDLNEGIMDIIKSPIKYMKISKNLKMYQKALIQQSINDVDYAKKKEASKEDPNPKTAEVLKQANLAKNQALKDQVDAINDRMTELSSGDEGLGKVVSIGKNKSKLQAAKVVMKATSGEEAKALKLEISTLEDRVADDEQSLKDYAAKQEPKEKSQAEKDAEDAAIKAKSDAQLGDTDKAAADKAAADKEAADKEAADKAAADKAAADKEAADKEAADKAAADKAAADKEAADKAAADKVDAAESGEGEEEAEGEDAADKAAADKAAADKEAADKAAADKAAADKAAADKKKEEEIKDGLVVELPLTIKLDESMTIAEKFARLMNK